MSTNQFKRQKWLNIARPAIMALVLLTVLTYVSYSWIKREWTPSVFTDEGIKIVAGDSLTFIFEDEVGGNTEINLEGKTLNELLDMRDFTLKSVSNLSGESNDFFRLEYGSLGEYYATFDHISRTDLPGIADDDLAYRQLGLNNGYIEMKFLVRLPEGADTNVTKGVYIHEDSFLKNGGGNAESIMPESKNPVHALRVSVTVHDYDPENSGKRDMTMIFATDERAKSPHSAVDNKIADGKYAADGAYIYVWNEQGPTQGKDFSFIGETDLLPFSMYGSKAGDPLFTLSGTESKYMTVRIWLEGEDKNCVNEISGSEIDLKLMFCAKTITPTTED